MRSWPLFELSEVKLTSKLQYEYTVYNITDLGSQVASIRTFRLNLKGLSSEIFLAENDVNQQVTLKGRGAKVFI
jgi:hypothetical protein